MQTDSELSVGDKPGQTGARSFCQEAAQTSSCFTARVGNLFYTADRLKIEKFLQTSFLTHKYLAMKK